MQLGKRENRAKHYEVDMTVGKPFHHLLNFAIPLLLGNLFVTTWIICELWDRTGLGGKRWEKADGRRGFGGFEVV